MGSYNAKISGTFEDLGGAGDPQAGRSKSAIESEQALSAYGDNFSGLTLAPAWTATSVAPTFPYSMPGASFIFDAQGDRITRTSAGLPSEYEVVLEMDYQGGNTQSTAQTGGFIGIGILDVNGTGVGASVVGNDPQTPYVHTVTTYNYTAAQQTAAFQAGYKIGKYAIALHKNGNNYRVRTSINGGASWSAYSATFASAHTVTQIGVYRFFTNGSNADSTVTLRYFEVFIPFFS